MIKLSDYSIPAEIIDSIFLACDDISKFILANINKFFFKLFFKKITWYKIYIYVNMQLYMVI